MSSNPAHVEVYSIQHYVIKFVSDLGQVSVFFLYSNFLHQQNWPPLYTMLLKYCWIGSGLKHQNHHIFLNKQIMGCLLVLILTHCFYCYIPVCLFYIHVIFWKWLRGTSSKFKGEVVIYKSVAHVVWGSTYCIIQWWQNNNVCKVNYPSTQFDHLYNLRRGILLLKKLDHKTTEKIELKLT